eukprot:1315637-Amorphochlora_amoeboformis.AAC.1
MDELVAEGDSSDAASDVDGDVDTGEVAAGEVNNTSGDNVTSGDDGNDVDNCNSDVKERRDTSLFDLGNCVDLGPDLDDL